MSAQQVVGCDVARGRWAAVVLDGRGFAGAQVHGSLAAVVDAFPAAQAIVVDIPIGLPEDGPRVADEEARRVVGGRRSSVFLTPVRAAIETEDPAAASSLSERITGKGTSRQAHALRRMILDAEPVARREGRVHEGHPEVTFATMAGAPLGEPKKTWNGLQARLQLLAEQGIVLPRRVEPGGDVAPDDLVDAAALAWTARRVVAREAQILGVPDERGHGVIRA